jgi:hypothetical protein
MQDKGKKTNGKYRIVKFLFKREKNQIESMQDAFTQQINSLIQEKVRNEILTTIINRNSSSDNLN